MPLKVKRYPGINESKELNMESPWMVWMRQNMPPDLYKQYIEDTKESQRWVYHRIKKLEDAIADITEACHEASNG